MISLRQHAISIAAIFLALAIGVVMGSGLLSSGLVSGLRDDKADLQTDMENATERNNQLTEQLNSADGFDSAVGGRVVADSLAQRTVMVVTTPDADPADLDGVNRMIAQAGGSVTGRVSLTDSFVDATGGDRLRTVVNNVIPAGVTLKTGAVDQGSSQATCWVRSSCSARRRVSRRVPPRRWRLPSRPCAAPDSSATTTGPSSLRRSRWC